MSKENTYSLGEVMKAIEARRVEDPLAEWMRSKGYDPDIGCMLFLPISMTNFDWGESGRPVYVHCSTLVAERTAFMLAPISAMTHEDG